MNIEQNIARLKKVNEASFIQNYIAQADARYILFNTLESRENFKENNNFRGTWGRGTQGRGTQGRGT